MQQLLMVFLGGGLGSMMRYGVGLLLNKESIPYGTGLVNILGSLLIGLFMGYHLKVNAQAFSQAQLAFLVIGFLGGFTTFSSFMYENLQFLFNEQYFRFFGYGLLSLVLGLMAVAGGYYLGRII
ncbi:MAG: fluoride efflux transporter CrcB [Flavobacteriales bacterium]|nr:MAG: fluoride efflux transporter CrcB [Flavobacteriales bacterium]